MVSNETRHGGLRDMSKGKAGQWFTSRPPPREPFRRRSRSIHDTHSIWHRTEF